MKSILVVEDDLALRTTMGFLFEELGVDVTLACNPSEALQWVRAREFDLFLTDLDLSSEASGVELIRAVRAIAPKMKFGLMTAAELRASSIGVAAGEFFPKPLDIDQLEAWVT